jgi:hypothetical protein
MHLPAFWVVLLRRSEPKSYRTISRSFGGVAIQREYDAGLEKYEQELYKRYIEEFHGLLTKRLRGESNDRYLPPTVSMQLEIAEELVAEQPELMLPTRKAELLAAVERVFIDRQVDFD